MLKKFILLDFFLYTTEPLLKKSKFLAAWFNPWLSNRVLKNTFQHPVNDLDCGQNGSSLNGLVAVMNPLMRRRPVSPHSQLQVSHEKIEVFCREYHVQKLSFFGSVLTDRFRPDSDIDVLIEFEKGHAVGYMGLAHMENVLSEMLGGRKVDLRTPAELSRYFRQDVISSSFVEYAKV